jgi:hypothetical protein
MGVACRFLKCSPLLDLRPYPYPNLTHGYLKFSKGAHPWLRLMKSLLPSRLAHMKVQSIFQWGWSSLFLPPTQAWEKALITSVISLKETISSINHSLVHPANGSPTHFSLCVSSYVSLYPCSSLVQLVNYTYSTRWISCLP